MNVRCSYATTHGPARAGWSDGRMASLEEFKAYGVHVRALEAVTPNPFIGRKRREKDGRHNGRSRGDGGFVLQALPHCNYPGRVFLERPANEGCWR